jgi:hypothetical protein
MAYGLTNERRISIYFPRILGLSAALFFFSVLDPVSLVLMHVSSLLVFFGTTSALKGIGLLGLSLFSFLVVRAGEMSPGTLAIGLSSVLFAVILRSGRFRRTFYPAAVNGLATIVIVMTSFALVRPGGLATWVDGLRSVMTEAMDNSYSHFKDAGVLNLDELVQLKEAMTGLVNLMITLVPAVAFINILLAGALSLLLFKLLTSSRKTLPETTDLKYFSFSDTFVWGLILGLASLVIPLPRPVTIVLLNVLTVATLLYLLRGLAVGVYWLRGKGLSPIFIGAIYAFLFGVLMPVFLLSLFLPGVLDTWYDFRSMGKVAQ